MQEKQYKVNPQHRDVNPNKIQWRVSINVELDLFRVSYDSCWFNQDKTWCFGIMSDDGKPQILGDSAKNNPPPTDLHFAKFVCDQSLWHGYPFGKASSDLGQIPKQVLDSWKKDNHISNAVKNKIHKGRYPL